MEVSVKNAADLLNVSEKTIYRWIRQGVIPTYKVQGQYRFDKSELEGWARSKRISGMGKGGAEGDREEAVNLHHAIQLGGIHYKIEGDSPEGLFDQIVDLLPFLSGASSALKPALKETLLEREALVSTGIGHGVALPHPRHPRDWGLSDPAVGLFFLEKPMDFKAVDGKPVYLLFVILCSSIKTHLKMLSQVSHLVSNTETRAYLETTPPRTELMERIKNAIPE